MFLGYTEAYEHGVNQSVVAAPTTVAYSDAVYPGQLLTSGQRAPGDAPEILVSEARNGDDLHAEPTIASDLWNRNHNRKEFLSAPRSKTVDLL